MPTREEKIAYLKNRYRDIPPDHLIDFIYEDCINPLPLSEKDLEWARKVANNYNQYPEQYIPVAYAFAGSDGKSIMLTPKKIVDLLTPEQIIGLKDPERRKMVKIEASKMDEIIKEIETRGL